MIIVSRLFGVSRTVPSLLHVSHRLYGHASIASQDPELFDVMEKEKNRQWKHVELIASENYTSRAVMEALGSAMTNKYSEGYPGARYYGGNEFIDMAENLCRKRALQTFRLDPKEWGVNVQSLSGSPANFEVYNAILNPFDKIMSLDLPHGGHLSHGYEIPGKKISAVSKYFTVFPYRLNEKTGIIDYDKLEERAAAFRPKLLVTGASAYPRHIDYAHMRKIADKAGSYFMMDMAHISGLVAGGVMPSPFEYADIVTTTTHKSLRGPRGAMIFFRRGKRDYGMNKGVDLEPLINASVFPGCQGGPHNHTISALATALLHAQSQEFVDYQKQVLLNSKRLANGLQERGYTLISGGTDNHLCLVNVKAAGLDGARAESTLDAVAMTANKNTIPGDVKAMVPGGIRLGTPAVTSRGMKEKDMDVVAEFFDKGIKIGRTVKKGLSSKKLSAFKKALCDAGKTTSSELSRLREEVESFAKKFPVPGFDVETMKYKN